MADRGILFSEPMVKALLSGRKTQTRRLLTLRGNRQFSEFGPSDTPGYDWHFRRADGCWCDHRASDLPLPYAPGDRLYVREANELSDEGGALIRRHVADGTKLQWSRRAEAAWIEEYSRKHCPSIHMPRWASRLWLAVTDVRVQRLQDISEADAKAEGCPGTLGPNPEFPDEWDPSPLEEYAALWNILHDKPGTTWADNPWVVATTFNVRKGNIDKESLHG